MAARMKLKTVSYASLCITFEPFCLILIEVFFVSQMIITLLWCDVHFGYISPLLCLFLYVYSLFYAIWHIHVYQVHHWHSPTLEEHLDMDRILLATQARSP